MNNNEFNIVIKNEYLQQNECIIPILFDNEQIMYIQQNCDMYDILVLCNIFQSRSQAKKNWNREVIIQDGWSQYLKIGKLNKSIYIFKPIHVEQTQMDFIKEIDNIINTPIGMNTCKCGQPKKCSDILCIDCVSDKGKGYVEYTMQQYMKENNPEFMIKGDQLKI